MKKLVPVEYSNQRILLTSQLAERYGVTEKIISNNFNNNKSRYVEGKDFYLLEGEELRAFKRDSSNLGIAENINKLYFWTEHGALLHAKSLGTDEAWEVYSELVDTYFRVQEKAQSGLPDSNKKKDTNAEQLRAKAMLLNAKNRLAKDMQKLYEDAGIKPEYKIMAFQDFYGADGPRLPAKALDAVPITYDKGRIAEKLGIYSLTGGKPHAQAVGAIIRSLNISSDEVELVPYYRNGHEDHAEQYKESVIDKVSAWLIDNNFPTPVSIKNKNYFVSYKA